MPIFDKSSLLQRMLQYIRSNGVGGLTSALDLRTFITDLIDSVWARFDGLSDARAALEWNTDLVYNTSTLRYVEWQGRLFKSKVDDNQGNEPPTVPNVFDKYEDDNWQEVSEGNRSLINRWKPGLYQDELVIVYWQHAFYELDENITRPFESINFDAELIQNRWRPLTAPGSSGHTISDGTADFAQRSKLIFEGANLTDNEEGDATKLGLATVAKNGLMPKEDKAKVNNLTEDGTGNPFYSNVKILRQGDAPAVTAADLSEMDIGQTNLFTVQKQPDGSAKYGAGIEQIDKLAAVTMGPALADSQAWNGQQLILYGDNSDGQLGHNSQEFYYKRRWYLCISSTLDSATWLRNAMVDALDAADPYDATIVAELENESGWNNNIKIVGVKSVKGDEYTGELSGYYYTCFSDDNKWRRIAEPATDQLFIQKANNFTALCNALEGHNFTGGAYDAIGLAAPNERGKQGQRYYSQATRALFECVISDSVNVIWEKIR